MSIVRFSWIFLPRTYDPSTAKPNAAGYAQIAMYFAEN
jgi:hypothetical protein